MNYPKYYPKVDWQYLLLELIKKQNVESILKDISSNCYWKYDVKIAKNSNVMTLNIEYITIILNNYKLLHSRIQEFWTLRMWSGNRFGEFSVY